MASFDQQKDASIPPSPWIVRFFPLIRRGGAVLDLAAGRGRQTGFFLQNGFSVVAADIDVSNLGWAQEKGAKIVEADLEGTPWPFAPAQFDGIVVCNYMHRPHFPMLADALAPGGVLLFDTFGKGNETVGRPRNPDFLLHPGELLDAFGAKLRIVAYEHGQEEEPRPAIRQRLCAIKIDNEDALNALPPGPKQGNAE